MSKRPPQRARRASSKHRQAWPPIGVIAALCMACGGGGDAAGADGGGPEADADPGAADADPGTPDAAPGTPDAGIDGGPPTGDYERLSQTGLYSDIASKTLAPGVIEFEPTYPLWSDGAIKRRWVWLPPGTTIDTSDMNHWVLPVGAKVWKEFRTPGGTLIETRLIERRDTGGISEFENVAWAASFVWRSDESDADLAFDGATDANGTGFAVPASYECGDCHQGQPGFVLGLSALQLSRNGGGTTLTSLAEGGLLSDPPAEGVIFEAPGNATERAALGYLHANCGHCHNPLGWVNVIDMSLMLNVEEDTPAMTEIYATAVDQALTLELGWEPPGTITLRVDSGSPTTSALTYRAGMRDGPPPDGVRADQMPPAFTTVVDSTGLSALEAWIAGL